MTNKLNDICADENVFVTKVGTTYIVTYRLETKLFRHIGLSKDLITGSPIGDVDIGIEITDEIIHSFNATSHKNIHNKLIKLYPEEFI